MSNGLVAKGVLWTCHEIATDMFYLSKAVIPAAPTLDLSLFLRIFKDGSHNAHGVICPSLDITFGLKRVNNERI